MLDHARPYEHNMCDVYLPPSPAPPAPLDNFHIFKKGSNSYVYGDYYSTGYELYAEPDAPAAAVYHDLLSSRECQRDYSYKSIVEWTAEDTMSWIFDTAKHSGFLECDIPFYNFKVSGNELRVMRNDEMQQRMAHPNVDPYLSRRIADTLFEKLQIRVTEEIHRQPIYRYHGEFPMTTQTEQTDMLDLDSLEHKARLLAACRGEAASREMPIGGDSSDEDPYRHSETASPDCSYSSDVSKSGDEDDKRKLFKRPPGRPKGSGRKVCKRPRSVSVPEFLRNLLLDPKYCPAIIKWEDHAQGKFRFVKPDEVAKLWGKMKQNDNMTFEKFSRAMRYHYRQAVLVSVPTARLVYQFGHKGPDINTDNPNFVKVKTELDIRDLYP